MRKQFRRVAVAFLATLLLAQAGLWIASYRWIGLYVFHDSSTPDCSAVYFAGPDRGVWEVQFLSSEYVSPDQEDNGFHVGTPELRSEALGVPRSVSITQLVLPTFKRTPSRMRWVHRSDWVLRLPALWTIVPMAVFIVWVYKGIRQRRNAAALLHVHCTNCGYDLRAHKPGDKCPECGKAMAKV